MNYCGSCQHISIEGKYPKMESMGAYHCKLTPATFYSLTRPRECDKWVEAKDLEARRELIRGKR